MKYEEIMKLRSTKSLEGNAMQIAWRMFANWKWIGDRLLNCDVKWKLRNLFPF